MLKQIRVIGNCYRSMSVTNALLSYEHVESDHGDYLVLHRVQIEIPTESPILIDCPIDDSETREHFEQMLSVNVCGIDVKSEVVS